MKIYLNGSYVSEDEAKISVFDHGVLYGDGVFEGIRAYHGRVFKLREHVRRLYLSARAIMLEIPMTEEEMRRAVVETCAVNGLREGYIRLVVTRGVGTLGLNPFRCEKPTVFIIAANIELYPKELYEKGLSLVTVPTMRNLRSALDPGIKSLNYLNNVLAKIEAVNAGVLEGVMLNAEGYVAECTGDNLFTVMDGRLITPPVSAGALNGITRAEVIDLAREAGREVIERPMSRYDLYISDECFLTGTAAEIVPVVQIDGRRISDGRPGPVTRGLLEAFQERTRNAGEPIPES